MVFVVEPDDYSQQCFKVLSIARAKNGDLNSFTSLSTLLTIGVQQLPDINQNMKRNQYLENLLLSQSNTPGSKEMEISFILVMFVTTFTHT
jgi:hypothetical protein